MRNGHLDAVRFVQVAWVKLLVAVYFLNNDSVAIGQVLDSDALFQTSAQAQKSKRYLIGMFTKSIEALAARLQKLDASKYAKEPELLNGVPDAEDADVGIHLNLVIQIVSACNALFSRFDFFVLAEHAESAKLQSKALRNGAVALHSLLSRLRYDKISKSLVELITCMSSLGIQGPQLVVIPDAVEATSPVEPGREEYFRQGWASFCSYYAHRHNIDLKDGNAMNSAIKDMALMFGSSKSYQNEQLQSLKELLQMLCDPECDDSIKLTALKVIRGVVYMNPDHASSSPQSASTEYARMLQNLPPAALGQDAMVQTQALLGKLGCVEVVTACIESDNQDIVKATLCLAVALLDGGNVQVQKLFAEDLRQASSQPFFQRLRSLFEQSMGGIRDMKKKVKRAAVERAALLKAGITPTTEEAGMSLADSQVHMAEVMKMMRRMCMGQFKPLQDILRVQRLNHTSFDLLNEAVQYIKNLEPELKDAIQNGEFELVDGAVRGDVHVCVHAHARMCVCVCVCEPIYLKSLNMRAHTHTHTRTRTGFLMLADSCRGPNLDNQKVISDAGIYDLCDRLFARVLHVCAYIYVTRDTCVHIHLRHVTHTCTMNIIFLSTHAQSRIIQKYECLQHKYA